MCRLSVLEDQLATRCVSASGGGGGGVVPPEQEWLTESEEEGMPVGDRDDWEDSESD